MMHFNETKTSMWAGIIFTSHFHDIYCLSIRLKCEDMNLVVDNFKLLKIIGDTNMIITNMNNMLVYPKEYRNTYRGILQLVYQDSPEVSQGSPLQVVS